MKTSTTSQVKCLVGNNKSERIRETDRETDGETDKETDRETFRQTEGETDRDTVRGDLWIVGHSHALLLLLLFLLRAEDETDFHNTDKKEPKYPKTEHN